MYSSAAQGIGSGRIAAGKNKPDPRIVIPKGFIPEESAVDLNPTKIMATQTATLPTQIVPSKNELLLPAFTLWWREVVRFYRQRSRVVGVIASPIVFWLVIGSGFGTSFRSG